MIGRDRRLRRACCDGRPGPARRAAPWAHTRRPAAWRRVAVAWLTVFALVLHLGALGAMAPHLAAVPGAAAAVVPDGVGPAGVCHDASGPLGNGGRGGIGHDCPVCQSLQNGLSLGLVQADPGCPRPEATRRSVLWPADARPPLTVVAGGGPRAPPPIS